MSTLRVNNLTAVGGTGTITVPTGNKVAQTGSILQVVSTTKTDPFTTTSSSFVDVTGLSATITPTSSSSKILVLFNGHGSISGSGMGHLRLLRGSTEIAIGDASGSQNRITSELTSGSEASSYSNHFLDSPNTTSATTYKIQAASAVNSQTLCINRALNDGNFTYRGRGVSSITLLEVAG